MILALAITGVVLLAALAALVYRVTRPTDRLQYDDESVILGGGMHSAGRKMGESLNHLAWGSGSAEMWRRRCEASLKASRARRARAR